MFVIVGDAFSGPLKEAEGLLRGKVLLHFQKMLNREVLQFTLGGVNLRERFFNSTVFSGIVTESCRKLLAAGLYTLKKGLPLAFVVCLYRCETGFLILGDFKLVVQPVVESSTFLSGIGGGRVMRCIQ